jgi:DNA polymerase (family 10)
MDTPKMYPKRIALAVARKIVEELSPACDRIEIVGSLRREVHTVHDVDIVLLPKDTPQRFALQEALPLENLLHQLVARNSLTPVRGKEKIKCFIGTRTGVPVDLYVATYETWATLLLIRTGSKEHNIKLAQRAKELGMKLRASGDGIEDANGALVRVTAEEEIFSVLQLRYVQPQDRN